MTTIATRPKAVTLNVRERARDWLSPVNLHWAGVAVLGLTCVYLLIQMGIAWRQTQSQNAEALASQQVALTAAKIAAKPLEGLDAKLARASTDADKFYMERLPVSYSEFGAELGVLKNKYNVRLTRAQYSQRPVADDNAGQLTEVDIDAALAGDYRPLITFINALERDKMFFLIDSVILTGQQSGAVNLRLRMTTYLRGTPSDEERQKAEVGGKADEASGSPESGLDESIDAATKRATKQAVKQGGSR
jgi:type IV pilus assembly protein PilO